MKVTKPVLHVVSAAECVSQHTLRYARLCYSPRHELARHKFHALRFTAARSATTTTLRYFTAATPATQQSTVPATEVSRQVDNTKQSSVRADTQVRNESTAPEQQHVQQPHLHAQQHQHSKRPSEPIHEQRPLSQRINNTPTPGTTANTNHVQSHDSDKQPLKRNAVTDHPITELKTLGSVDPAHEADSSVSTQHLQNKFNLVRAPAAGSIRRVVVLQKVSLLEELRRGLLSDRLSKHIQNDARAHLADREHSLTIDQVQHTLLANGIETRVVERLEIRDVDWCDMIVCVGGDGTFLRASRYMDEYLEKPIVGVNSSPSSSFGFFSAADHSSFSSLLQRIINGVAPMRPLWRMRVMVNNKPVGNLVLNEALFSSPLPSGTTRYVLRNGGVEQSQVSSGVWISTASGSTGAIHAAGGDIQALDDKRIQYRVRELFTLSAVKAAGPAGSLGILSGAASPPHVHKVSDKVGDPFADNDDTDHDQHSHLVRSNNNSSGTGVHRPSTEDHSDQLDQHTVDNKGGLIPVAQSATKQASISSAAATVLRQCGDHGFALMEGGFLAEDFMMVSRMQSATIYLDGGGPNSAVEVGFGDRVSFRTSARPLHWVSPTLPPPYDTMFTDNWQVVTGRVRPANPEGDRSQREKAEIQQEVVEKLVHNEPIPSHLSPYRMATEDVRS